MGFFPQFPGFGGRQTTNQNVTVKKGADIGGLLGGTPMDDGQALSLGILQAMPQLQQAGYERSASPVGSIAKNLMPLFGAMIYAQAAQQQAQAQQADAQVKHELVRSQILKNLADAGRTSTGGKGGFEGAALEALRNGDRAGLDDIIKTQQAMRAPKSPTTMELQQRVLAGDPEAKALLDADTQRQVGIQSAGANARNMAKKLPTPEINEQYARDIQSLDSVNALLDKFESNPPTKGSAVASKLSGGYMSEKVWRDYNRFYNNVGHGLYGGQFTKNEAERLHQVLPDPLAYAVNPQGFYDALVGAREEASNVLKKQYDYDSSSLEMNPLVLADVIRSTSPRKAAGKSGGAKDATFSLSIPAGMDDEINQLTDQMLHAGKSEEEVGRALDSLIKSRTPKPK